MCRRTLCSSISCLSAPESSGPYSQVTLHASLYGLDGSSNCANKKQGKHLVQGLKGITGSKSTYDFGTEFSADSTKSIQRLTDSVAGIDDGSISLVNTSGDHTSDNNNDFAQGRRASLNPTPTTSKWHKFTNSSTNTNIPSSFSTSDLDHLL